MRYFISLLGLAVIVGAGYFAVAQYISVAHGQSSLLTPQSSTDISADAAQVLALLSRLQSIDLDTDSKVLSNQTFLSLQDWTVNVPTQATGRSNPFLPAYGVTPVSTMTKVSLPKSH